MQICVNYIPSIYSNIFITIEYILIVILLLLYLKKINDLIKLPNISYDKIDLIIIYLSALQLLLFLIRLIKNYNIFSVLISINKFSQNLMICALLLLYILGKYEKGKATLIKYFLVTLLILDILIFLIDINDSLPFDTKDNETIDHLIIYLFCLIFDCFIWYKSFINKKNMNNKIEENYEKNKLDNIINKKEKLIENNKEIFTEKENGFINTIYFQNLNNVIIIISIYFYILVTFLISYLIDIILYLSDKSNLNDNNVNNYNETNYNNTILNNTKEINKYDSIFMQENKNPFSFWDLIVSFIFFFLRDILPYLVIYLMFFIYKGKYYQRSSF
jgi:hypothetical protein